MAAESQVSVARVYETELHTLSSYTRLEGSSQNESKVMGE